MIVTDVFINSNRHWHQEKMSQLMTGKHTHKTD